MKKLIDLEGLKVFLGECKKNFALQATMESTYAKKADAVTSAEIDRKLADYAKVTALTDFAKKSDVAKAVQYRGSIDTYDALPKSGMVVGDMYNVLQADSAHAIKAGDNVVYNGNDWDNLGGVVDLSAYATKSDVQQAILGGIEVATESEVQAVF